MRPTQSFSSVVALTLSLAIAGCGGASAGGSNSGGAAAGAGGSGGKGGSKQTPEAGYVIVEPGKAPLIAELPARTSAYEMSDVRPQVNGIILKRNFTEGSLVRKGQKLYEIDPSLYRAAANQASANLQSAQATAAASRALADRYRPLAQIQAVAEQDLTNAQAQAQVGTATVAQNRAALRTARINLNYTSVPAPISGRIGRSLYTVGALVSASQTNALAQIQQLDPIYVDIQQSSSDVLALRRSLASGGIVATRAQVRLKLEDGSDYGLTGSVEFAEAIVDPSTGSVTLRARFANPHGLLLPGMFVRASFAQGINPHAFLIPQGALSRDAQGNASVMLVGPGDKVVQRQVVATQTLGPSWVVTGGLQAGDKLITEGLGKVHLGAKVAPVAAGSPPRKPSPGGKDGGKTGGAQRQAG